MEGNLLVSIFDENQLRTIVEDAVRKIMLELKEDVTEVDEWLSTEQIKEMLHVSKSTIVNWRKQGILKSHKLGNRILFKREEILAKISELRPFRSVEDSVH